MRGEPIHYSPWAGQPDVQIECDRSIDRASHSVDDDVHCRDDGKLYTFETEHATCAACVASFQPRHELDVIARDNAEERALIREVALKLMRQGPTYSATVYRAWAARRRPSYDKRQAIQVAYTVLCELENEGVCESELVPPSEHAEGQVMRRYFRLRKEHVDAR